MNRDKVWIALMIFGIMLITTVCYLTLRNNTGKQYADGEIVQVNDMEDQDIRLIHIEWK